MSNNEPDYKDNLYFPEPKRIIPEKLPYKITFIAMMDEMSRCARALMNNPFWGIKGNPRENKIPLQTATWDHEGIRHTFEITYSQEVLK